MQISMIIVLILTVVSTAMRNNDIIIDEEELLSKALVTIIVDFYANQSNTLSIWKVSLNQLGRTQNTIVRNICTAIEENLTVALNINDEAHLNGSTQLINHIILIDTYESFGLISKYINPKLFDYSGYYTIVLTEFHENHYTITENILKDCWKYQITNVNILLQRNANETGAILYTYFPFTPFHCEEVVPVIWNYFSRDRFIHPNKQLFPSKMSDLCQCSIKVVTLEIRPYIFLQRSHPNNSYNVQGIDANIIYVLAKKMNFKPLFLVPDDIPRRGVIHKNGNVTGALGMVFKRKANISIAAIFYTSLRESILTASRPYMYEQLVFVVPNPTPYSSFEILFIPFELSTWTTICLTIVIAVIVINIVKHYNRAYQIVVESTNQSPYMNLIYAFLVGPTLKEPKQNFTRFLVITWIIACFVLRTVYQGDLFTIIKMNKMKESVRSIDELIEQNISVKLIDELLTFVTFDKRIDKQLRFFSPSSYWNYVTQNEAYVYLLSPLIYNATRIIYGSGISTQIKTLRIGTYPFVMYMPKHSCLTAEINDEIQYVQSSGLIEKWTAEYKEKRFAHSDDENIPRKLDMSQLIGIFQLCGWLLVAALILFIFEMLSSIVPQRKCQFVSRHPLTQ